MSSSGGEIDSCFFFSSTFVCSGQRAKCARHSFSARGKWRIMAIKTFRSAKSRLSPWKWTEPNEAHAWLTVWPFACGACARARRISVLTERERSGSSLPCTLHSIGIAISRADNLGSYNLLAFLINNFCLNKFRSNKNVIARFLQSEVPWKLTMSTPSSTFKFC